MAVFAAVGAGAPYLPLYYQSLGMSLDAIGLLAAVVALSALISAPAWGVLSDALGGSRLVLPVACLLGATVVALVAFMTDPLIVALLAIAFWIAFAGVSPLLDSRALETVADDQNRYSRLRAWGSASFVVSAIVVGALIQVTELRVLFLVLVTSLVAAAVFAFGLRAPTATLAMPRLSGVRAVLSNRTLQSFLVAALIAWAANSSINAFLSIYLIDIGAPSTLVGFSWAIGAAVEIPLMIAFPLLARRFGIERLVLAGAVLLCLRAITIALVHDPTLAALTMVLHGGGFALLLVGGVTYVARHAPSGAAATAQGVLSGVVVGLAQVIGPGIGGFLASQFGLTSLFLISGAVGMVAIGGLAIAFGLRQGAPGQPADSASELG